MMNATNLRKNNYRTNLNKHNLINSSISSLSSESKSIPGDRIKLSKNMFNKINIDTRKKIPNKKPEIIKIKNLINLNTEDLGSKNKALKITSKKKETTISNNYHNNLYLNLSVNKNKQKKPANNNYVISYRNNHNKRNNYLNEIDYCSRPFNNKNYNTNIHSSTNNLNIFNRNNNNNNNNLIRERINTDSHNNVNSQIESVKNNNDELIKLSNVRNVYLNFLFIQVVNY